MCSIVFFEVNASPVYCDGINKKICVSQAINYFKNGNFKNSFIVLKHINNPDLINFFYWVYNSNYTARFSYISDKDYWKSLKMTNEIKDIFYKNQRPKYNKKVKKHKNIFMLSGKIPKTKKFILTQIADKIKNKKTPSAMEIKFLYQYVSNDSNIYYYAVISQIANKDYDQAYKLLTNINNVIIDKKKLWYLHKLFIREVIYNKHQDAYKYLVKLANKELDSNNVSIKYESNWLSGWVNHYINNKKEAAKYFKSILKFAKMPGSISGAAYWSAMNIEDIQQKKSLLKLASNYPRTFYGQISSYISKNTLNIDQNNIIDLMNGNNTSDENNNSYKNKTIQIIKLFISINEEKLAEIFINKITNIATVSDIYHIYQEIEKVNNPYLIMRVAQILESKGINLIEGLYPIAYLNLNATIPHSLMLAIIRQESAFQYDVMNKDNDTGLMQIIPSTAEKIAKKHKIAYKYNMLYNASYNIKLGTTHLGDLLNYYDNSLVLAISAYNAGTQNVDKWIVQIGDPRKINDDIYKVLNWIEKIPFGGTREYVKNVISNMIVYQKILKSNSKNKSKKIEDLQNFFTINYRSID